MSVLRFTLLSEGSSDQALVPIVVWSIRRYSDVEISPQWADLRHLPDPPKGLANRIDASLQLYPCDVLFVHRDADSGRHEERVQEIESALAGRSEVPAVCVIPVRCLEAWFLFDERAIRRASGNPRGASLLDLPKLKQVEDLANPKDVLYRAIITASELSGRRKRRVEPAKAVHRIANVVRDFSPLRQLPAFVAMEENVERVLNQLGLARADGAE